MKKITKILLGVLFIATSSMYGQGSTTSSINGKVMDGNSGEPLLGATIVAVQDATGTKYGAATDLDGNFRISNMRVAGGAYTITTSYVGFSDDSRKNVILELGNTLRLTISLGEQANALDEIVITSSSGLFSGNKTGSETNINRRQIANLPSASRSLTDFVRITPQAQISEGSDGFSVSLAGQNNRFNAIYVDGAVSNDVFGLAGSGTNGGQTGVSPFSIDAIESFQVAIAPFDVKIAGFTGGAINAITRSGTNEFQGSAYTFFRNESLAGKTPPFLVNSGDQREKLNEFSAKTYGFRLGGPIIKDKLFFFVNYERQDDVTPQPFNVSNYDGDSSAAEIGQLSQYVADTYGYDVGVYDKNDYFLESDKIIVKFDYNVNDNNKLSLKHSYTKADNLESRNSGSRDIGFLNGSESFISKTNSTSFEWSSNIGDKYANNLLIGYTQVRDDRDPLGNPFPSVSIEDGSGDIAFGAEPFSTANLLDSDIWTLTNNFEIYKGNHTFTIGTHNEYSEVKNLFFAFNYGAYEYNSVQDFYDDNGNLYQRGYSLLADGSGDTSSGAAEFNIFQAGLYAMDEIQINDNFKLSLGVRFDMPFWSDGAVNEDFNTRTIPLLEAAGKDLEGAEVGKKVEASVHFSPRLGFNWNVKGESQTQIRGGVGVFTSRVPLVWPGGTYNNNGVTGGFEFKGSWFTTIPAFNPDVNSQPVGAVPGTGETGGNIDLFSPDFKLPQVLKFNVAVDQKLPWWGLTFSGDFSYNKTLNHVYYQNLNVGAPVGNLTGTGDNRPIYDRGDEIDSAYDRIILGTNTSKGDSYNIVGTLSKSYDNGFSGSLSYSYGDSNAIFDGTSSQNSSQWRGIQNVNGKNSNLPVSRSDFAAGSRIVSQLTYEHVWNDNLKSTFGLFYDGRQGSPSSYVYRNSDDLQQDDSRGYTSLIYVPTDASDINLTSNNYAALDAFIEGDDYLKTRRGNYTERNAQLGPWSHIVDLKFVQEFKLDKNALQVSFDIFNFTNLINKDWGKLNTRGSSIELLEFEGFEADDTTPTFSFDESSAGNIDRIDDSGLQSSRWQMQMGIRYLFN
ncbi:MAG: hypothetical protein ACI8Q1_003669 [Parvicella sp.]|jgi:hypothetical protein